MGRRSAIEVGQMAQGLAVWAVHGDLLTFMLMPKKQ